MRQEKEKEKEKGKGGWERDELERGYVDDEKNTGKQDVEERIQVTDMEGKREWEERLQVWIERGEGA